MWFFEAKTSAQRCPLTVTDWPDPARRVDEVKLVSYKRLTGTILLVLTEIPSAHACINTIFREQFFPRWFVLPSEGIMR
jgi:hypothetical protein